MDTKRLSAVLLAPSSACHTKLRSAVGIGLIGVVATISSVAWAEQSQQQPKSDDHQQLCRDLYIIYDTNMDEYYNKKNSGKMRQSYYGQAEKALSDFRKRGCKKKDMK